MTLRNHESSCSDVPAPVWYVAAFLTGIGLDALWPLSLLGQGWRIIAGIACIVASGMIMPPVLLRFHRERTPFNPRKTALALVTDGPYRFSRHPSYVALTLLYLGGGLLLDNGWILLLAVPVLLAMDQWVVRREEHRLRGKFGAEYLRYASRVRRWL